MCEEVLSLASCYGRCVRFGLGGSGLSLLSYITRHIFWTAQSWLDTVTACDLRHEWVTMDGVK